MALYAELQAAVAVYADTAKYSCKGQLHFDTKTLTCFNVEASARMALAGTPSGTPADVAVSMQSVVAGQLLLLQSDTAFGFKLNSGATINVKPRTNSDNVVTPAFVAIMGDGITSLSLSNPNTTAITVDVCLAGI